jgi:hypothetical protein
MYKFLIIALIALFTTAVVAQEKFSEQSIYRPGYLDQYAYNPRSALLDFDIGHNPSYYDRILSERVKRDEATTLMKAESARVIPTGIEDSWVVYPDDWVEKTKKREKYEHGELVKGTPDSDGKYVVIYDISDLIYQPPNFASPFDNPAGNFYRNYHRWNQPYDLFDQQQPMLEDVGPHYSEKEAERIANLIRALLRDDGEVHVLIPEQKMRD